MSALWPVLFGRRVLILDFFVGWTMKPFFFVRRAPMCARLLVRNGSEAGLWDWCEIRQAFCSQGSVVPRFFVGIVLIYARLFVGIVFICARLFGGRVGTFVHLKTPYAAQPAHFFVPKRSLSAV